MANPSLAYEVLIYLNSFYFGMFASCELCIILLKGMNLPYKGYNLAIETALVLVFCALETFRIMLGRKGSLIERDWHVILSVVLLLPSLIGAIFLVTVQSYVFRLEYCLGALMILLLLSEIWTAIRFVFFTCRPVTYD